jgi:hypothetical protein
MSKYPRIHPAREERAHDFRAEIGQPNIAGRLGRNQAPVGALISVAGAPMNTLVQLDPIYVTFNPSETDLVVIQRARAAGKVAADTLLCTKRRFLFFMRKCGMPASINSSP